MQYRRRFDILADVLRATGSGAKKTRIMFLANLSYALLKRYLEEAVSLGFLQSSAEEFLVTPKGEEFLSMYNALRSTSSRVKADLENLRSETELLEQMCKLEDSNRKVYSKRRSTFAALAQALIG